MAKTFTFSTFLDKSAAWRPNSRFLLFCWAIIGLTLLSAAPAAAQLASDEDTQYTPMSTPVRYRWYGSNSGYQYWYISGGQGTINSNSSYTNGYQATVTWTATGPSQITYVTSSGQYSLNLTVVECRPIPGANMSNALDAGTFDICPQTRTFTANTTTDCYLNDYFYNSASNTGNPKAQPSPDVYYKFTLKRASQVTVSTCGSGFDTYLHLLSTSPGQVQVWDDDDSGGSAAVGCASLTSYLSSLPSTASGSTLAAALPATLPPGDYFIVAEGWSDRRGALQVNLTVTPQFTASLAITSVPAASAATGFVAEITSGSSATLSAAGEGLTAFTWLNAQTGATVGSGASISVSPTEMTTYQVTSTACNGSVATAQVTVQVVLSTLNYITTRTAQVAGLTASQDMNKRPPAEMMVSTTYFDGMGRPMQKVEQGASPNQQSDLVQLMTYDAMGRVATRFLPYPQDVNAGTYKPDALTKQAAFYQPTTTLSRTAQDASPFAVTRYEASPLDRVLEQGASGAAWQPGTGHSVKLNQRTNTAEEGVRQLTYDFATNAFAMSTTYGAGQLLVKETRDEQDQLVTEYADKQGHTVLKRVAASTVCQLAAAPNGGTFQLSAPSGYVATIRRAVWGKQTAGTNCDDVVFDPQFSKDVTSYVQALIALRNPSVSFTIDYANLGPDPYPAGPKYLLVEATYVPVGLGTDLLTYYGYDDLDNLRLVVSPEGVNTLASTNYALTADFIRNWCFRYDYDGLHRVISKQTPGAAPVALAYNQRNQPVLTQDGNQAKTNEWTFTKYDGLGRPIMTGVVNLSGDRAAQQALLDTQTVLTETVDLSTSLGYTSQAFPQSITDPNQANLLSLTYYDRYKTPACSLPADQWLLAPRGLATESWSRTLLPDGTAGAWLTTTTYYDKNYRSVQTVAQHQLSGTTTQTTSYDFAGKVLSSTTSVTQGNATTVAYQDTKTYTYYDNGLPKETFQQVYNTTTTPATPQPKILLVKNGYNELGQLIAKYLHSADGTGSKFLQKVDYRYNIRGWLTHINNRDLDNNNIEQSPGVYVQDTSEPGIADPDLFGLELVYNNAEFAGAVAQYNGNIAQAMWQTRGPDSKKTKNNKLRAYNYSYDAANRIAGAQYATCLTSGWNSNQLVDFTVANIKYDGNGNLLSMTRQGTTSGGDDSPTKGTLDQLTYSYKKLINGQLVGSNRLLGVDDAVVTPGATHDFEDNGSKYDPTGDAEYGYDPNGNLISDANKGITTISYTRLNQPAVISFKAMPTTGNVPATIKYTYTAAGLKLAKQVFSNGMLTKTTYYVGPVIFEATPGNSASPVFAQTPEGRVLYAPASNGNALSWKYEYHLKDHLGNLRFAFRADRDDAGQTTQFTAGMESANAPKEERQFSHVAETRLADPDHARTGRYVARLAAHTGRQQGPSLRLRVAAGDSVRAEVYARYDHESKLANIIQKGALVVGATTISVPGQLGTDRTNQGIATARPGWVPFVGASLAVVPQRFITKRAELPTAYLRYELFTKDSQLVATRIQALHRTTTDEWQKLQVGLKADSAGFVHVSLVNETNTPAYFDDMAVNTVATTPYQENHYDPFGLNLVGIEQSSLPNSGFQYNGKEKQEDFGLNWSDYGARMYDAQLGRWHVTDPLADLMRRFSPYCFSFDNPMRFVDPDGMAPVYDWEAHNRGEKGVYRDDSGEQVSWEEVQETYKVKPPKIISRAEWGARPPIIDGSRSWEPIKGNLKVYYRGIVIHHSGNLYNSMTIKQLQSSEQDKYADIPYHFAIDRQGNIYEGRPLNIKGAHVKGNNTGNIGIVLLSDLDTENRGMPLPLKMLETIVGDGGVTDKMIDSLYELTRYLAEQYGIEYLGGHQEVLPERFCPGNVGMEWVEAIRKNLRINNFPSAPKK